MFWLCLSAGVFLAVWVCRCVLAVWECCGCVFGCVGVLWTYFGQKATFFNTLSVCLVIGRMQNGKMWASLSGGYSSKLLEYY